LSQTTPAHRAPEIELVRIGGRTLRVAHWKTEKPRGRPILFFNGIGANIELMTPLGDWIADRDIFTFDMPGVGRSPSSVLPYRPWMIARLAARLLDHYRIDKVDVMGVSWGGGMAQQFTFQHGRRVGKLILAATSAGTIMAPGNPQALAKMAHPRRYIDPDYMKENFALLYGGDTAGADDHVAKLHPPSRMGYLYQLSCMIGWTSLPFLPFVRHKTLILMGDQDQIVPVVNGRILESFLPNARLEIVKGGGHLFLVSRAAEVVPTMLAFLNGPDASLKGGGAWGRIRAKAA
jgi:poly(3-hydroxyalkanoate) depolymerase